MIQPDALKSQQPLMWSTGAGVDVWEMFRATVAGDLASLGSVLDKDPALVRAAYEYRTALDFAVRENQVEAARLLLDRGANPITAGFNHGTLLAIPRERGFDAMARLLESELERRYGISERAEPLAEAIRERSPAKVRSLLDAAPELIDIGDARGNRPIHWAVMMRQLDLIDELLARGADLSTRRPDGARPIHLTNGDYHFRGWRDVPEDVVTTPAVVRTHLIERGAHLDIWTAAYTGNLDRVKELLDGDPALVNRNNEYNSYYLGCGSPLRNAAATGHMEIVRLLLDRGADPNLPQEHIAPRGHALYSAAANGHHAIARLLLERGADPNTPVESSADPLSRAINNNDREMVDLLTSYGARRPLHLLAYYGDVEAAEALLSANPALADDPEAMIYAATEGQEAFVRLLLRYRPDLLTRVSVAAKTRDLTGMLFAHGMDPNRPNWLHVTQLHRLADRGDTVNAALFLDRGADPNSREEDLRSTPLAWAARSGKQAMVEMLLARGASPSLPDDPPWATPLAWAERRGHREIAGVLRARLGKDT